MIEMPETTSRTSSQPLKALRVLVVEDDALIAMLYVELLEEKGHAVCAIETTEADAVVGAARDKPDLMIVDYRLADGNGGDICRKLKVHPWLKHVPLIMWSAYTGPDLNLQQYGCDAILNKPFDIEDFLNVVGQLLSRDGTVHIS